MNSWGLRVTSYANICDPESPKRFYPVDQLQAFFGMTCEELGGACGLLYVYCMSCLETSYVSAYMKNTFQTQSLRCGIPEILIGMEGPQNALQVYVSAST